MNGADVDAQGLNRRAYLGALGGAVLGTAIAGNDTVSAGESTYETIVVSEDEREITRVGAGETIANVLYDVTAEGASVTIIAEETDWTIRDVAVRGRVDMGNEPVIAAADTDGGTSSIENVWLGDGARYEEDGGIGIFVYPEHSGHLEINRTNVQHMSDNGFYCSAPGLETGKGGTVAFENCFAANNRIAQYRLAEGSVENCTAAVTDDRRLRIGRGVWAWAPGPVEVRDSQFLMNGHQYSFVAGANDEASQIEVVDSQYDDAFEGGIREAHDSTVTLGDGVGTDPERIVPEGCPSSIADVFGEPEGNVTIEDQESPGGVVEVRRATFSEAAFAVALEDESGAVIGESEVIDAGTIVENLRITLEEPLEGTQSITAAIYTPDGEPIEVNGVGIREVAEVTVPDDPEHAYGDDDGAVATDGLRTAIDDWRAGGIDTDLLRDVIAAWRAG